MEVFEFLIKLLSIIFLEIFEGFVRIFVPKKPKNIRGKLALVTGLYFFYENFSKINFPLTHSRNS